MDKVDPNASTPSRAVGLTARSYFKFLRPPAGDYYKIADHSRAHDTPCSGAKDEGFFEAEDAQDATDGYLIWLNLQSALRQGEKVPMDCDLSKMETRSCNAIVLGIAQNDISSVKRCETDDSGEQCFEILTDDQSVRIFANGHVSPGPPPNKVRRAVVGEMITMWHERSD